MGESVGPEEEIINPSQSNSFMVLLCHSVNETGHPIVHSSKLRWNSFGFEARESRHLHEAATCQTFLDVGGWLVGPPSPQNIA